MRKNPKGFATFSLEYLALGLVLFEPKHGYQLYEAYQKTFGPIWKVGRSKFYAALATLHDDGYLSVTTEHQAVRPPRKVYTVTDAGHAHFVAWLHRPVTPMRAVRVELIAKLRFFVLLDLPGLSQLIDDQLAVCHSTRDLWAQRLAEIAETRPDARPPVTDATAAIEHDLFMPVVYDFRLRQAQFIIDWLESARTALRAQQA